MTPKSESDWKRLREQCALTQIELLSVDIKEVSRLKEAKFARNVGIGFLSGVAGWLAGPVIARRIITQRPRVARAIARGTIAGGLSWSGFRVNNFYDRYLVLDHPNSAKIQFLQLNMELMDNHMARNNSRSERLRTREIIQQWKTVMNRDPLFRNQQELDEVVQVNNNAIELSLEVYDHLPKEMTVMGQAAFERFYYWPALKHVYGVNIRDEDERDQFMEHLERQESISEKVDDGPKWTLGAPEKSEGFWEWFWDDRTGKPVMTDESEEVTAVETPHKRSRPGKKKPGREEEKEKTDEEEN